jgi:hypothetical protein
MSIPVLERYESFHLSFVSDMKEHILKQVSDYTPIKLISFIQSQRMYFEQYLPEKRKQYLYNEFLKDIVSNCHESEAVTMDNIVLNKEEEKEFCMAFEQHSKAYFLLHDEMEKIFATLEHSAAKASAAEPPKEDKAEDEPKTTEQKVRRILKPLTEKGKDGMVILDNDSFKKLVMTYVNYIEKNEYPKHAERFIFHGTNPEFYRPLKELHSELRIKISGIGQLLTYILSPNNKYGERGEAIAPGTIEKNIKKGGQY